MNKVGKFVSTIQRMTNKFDCDLVVIGGGSGGLAASKEAVKYGAQDVVLFDYVRPTVHNVRWGLGGTCVNVGCIPKKLMHYSGLMGPILRHDALHSGWNLTLRENEIAWPKLVDTIQLYIKRLNFGYRTQLRTKGVKYINALATLEGPHEVSYLENNQKKVITAKYILIAVGGRPYVPPEERVPGARRYAITSDDLFSLKSAPGKTLVVGASYIALECAGFLHEFGYEVKVAVRSILLRGFDQQCARKVGELMKETGIQFMHQLPQRIEKLESGKLLVYFSEAESDVEEFDTVMYATGRLQETKELNYEKLGITVNEAGKIVCQDEQTTVPSIYCVGDCLHNGKELTPVAIKAGELLAQRLFGNGTARMNWQNIPTTVFTPFEYGACGLSEEEAIKQYGEENLEIYLSEFTNLEISALHREKVQACREGEYDDQLSPTCLSKLICLKSDDMRVIGIHFVGPNAGEVIQGYAIALRLGAKKRDFDETIGIHPTAAEAFHCLEITKASGVSYTSGGGCGGGKCG